jgi:type IV pilus assembly protein PilB
MADEQKEHKLLGQILIEKELITEGHLEDALDLQETSLLRIGEQLIKMGLVNETDVIQALSEQLDVPILKLDEVDDLPFDLVEELGFKFCKENKVIPVLEDKESQTIHIVHDDPLNIFIIDDVEQKTGQQVKFFIDSPSAVERAIARLRSMDSSELEQVLGEMENLEFSKKIDDEGVDLGEAEGPIVTLVNKIIANGITEGCTDIHVEPSKKKLRIRYRRSGVLCDLIQIPDIIHKFQPQLISRLKLMADMDISERRLPQDGRIRVMMTRGKSLDIRVNCLPVQGGEKISMRILDSSAANMSLEEVGFSKHTMQIFERNCKKPNGMMMVAGPTGSGKTTTLYACLNYINTTEVNICTTEDPVEYSIQGYNQVQVCIQAGLTFPSALRALLRQDPDIILVGEMRDSETAEIGVEAAMTGHLVFSTMHTNSAAGVVGRLTQMGVPGYLVASTLLTATAQNLVRVLCKSCRNRIPLSREALEFAQKIKADVKYMYEEVGCRRCSHTGYSGRMGVHETMENNIALRECIAQGLDEHSIESIMAKKGFLNLRKDGLLKLLQGYTSENEVNRVCR